MWWLSWLSEVQSSSSGFDPGFPTISGGAAGTMTVYIKSNLSQDVMRPFLSKKTILKTVMFM
jgi:hypothetical protein